MHGLVGFPLFLVLAGPALAWAGQIVSTSPATSSLAMSRVVTAQSTLPGPVSKGQRGPVRVGKPQTIAANPAVLCETAVTIAEYVNRLPPRLLEAISLTETGRVADVSGRIRPWPWTIDAEGEGQFFDTKDAAIAAVRALQNRGVRSIDVGCLQVNLMYHPDAFASLEDAFDPRSNANYAAGLLNALYAEDKGWPAAVAAYHSETPALGDAYRVLVMARWQNGDPHVPIASQGAYGDFAHSGQAYDDKAYGDRAYGAFAPRSLVYGAFAPR